MALDGTPEVVVVLAALYGVRVGRCVDVGGAALLAHDLVLNALLALLRRFGPQVGVHGARVGRPAVERALALQLCRVQRCGSVSGEHEDMRGT